MVHIYTSAWEVGDRCPVLLDDSVLDQILHGNPEVYWEIQALQDSDVLVKTTPDPSRSSDSNPALGILRNALREELELPIDWTGTSSRAGAALWSVRGSKDDRIAWAGMAGADLYEPEIRILPAAGEISGQEALARAISTGALPVNQAVPRRI